MKQMLAAALAVAFLATHAHAGPNLEAEKAAVMQVSRDWAKAASTRDVERIVSYWSDDAIMLPPGQPAMVGKTAIRAFVQGMLAVPGFSITWEPERAWISASADVAYLVERAKTTVADSTGALQTQYAKAVTVWRKDANGAWKCVLDTWNDSPVEQVVPAVR